MESGKKSESKILEPGNKTASEDEEVGRGGNIVAYVKTFLFLVRG